MDEKTLLVLLVSACVNAMAILAARGLQRDIGALKELMTERHDALEFRVDKLESWHDSGRRKGESRI